MAIIKTEAVVLKVDNYRESSKLLTLFTRTHGKIRCIAKGVRKPEAKWGGTLQSMACLNIIFYYKENRNLNLISNAEYKYSNSNLYKNYEKLNIGYRIIEIVNKTTTDYHENQELFELLTLALRKLNYATKNYVNVLFKFEFDLAKILGFAFDIEKLQKFNEGKVSMNMKKNHGLYMNGSSVQKDGNDNSVVKEPSSTYLKTENRFIDLLNNGNFDDIIEVSLIKKSSDRIEKFLESHFIEHIANIGMLKSKKVAIN